MKKVYVPYSGTIQEACLCAVALYQEAFQSDPSGITLGPRQFTNLIMEIGPRSFYKEKKHIKECFNCGCPNPESPCFYCGIPHGERNVNKQDPDIQMITSAGFISIRYRPMLKTGLVWGKDNHVEIDWSMMSPG